MLRQDYPYQTDEYYHDPPPEEHPAPVGVYLEPVPARLKRLVYPDPIKLIHAYFAFDKGQAYSDDQDPRNKVNKRYGIDL